MMLELIGWRFCQVCGRKVEVFNYSCSMTVETCQHYLKDGSITEVPMKYISKVPLIDQEYK